MDKQLLLELSSFQSELVEILQDIHSHPELSMQEKRTSKLIADKLREYDITVTENVGRTGVVGTLESTSSGDESIGLRADIDALGLTEKTDLAYSSTVPGVMHACGHDGHTVMLLGAAKYLSKHRDSFRGTVYFIFQPGEEKLEGALAMINDKLFERFPMRAVYGLHNLSQGDVGKFHIRPGSMMAASDRWYVTFRGSGGYGGANPHLTTDLTVVQAQFILALQTVVSRNIAAADSAVISVGAIQGGSFNGLNIMPSEVRIGGTARSFTKSVRNTIERRIRELAHGLAESFGCVTQVEYYRFGVPLINHETETSKAIKAAGLLVGEENVNGHASALTAAEDFAYMLEEKPGAYIILANGSKHGPVHSPTYVFNPECIPFGIGYWIKLVQLELKP